MANGSAHTIGIMKLLIFLFRVYRPEYWKTNVITKNKTWPSSIRFDWKCYKKRWSNGVKVLSLSMTHIFLTLLFIFVRPLTACECAVCTWKSNLAQLFFFYQLANTQTHHTMLFSLYALHHQIHFSLHLIFILFFFLSPFEHMNQVCFLINTRPKHTHTHTLWICATDDETVTLYIEF